MSRLPSLALAGLIVIATLIFPSPTLATVSEDVAVVDLPVGVRALPRGVFPVGRTDDGHTVFDAEQDPFGRSPGLTEHRIAAADGTVTTLDSGVESVVGNRLVQEHTDTTVTSRLASMPTWTTKTVPAGYTVLDYTADGLVLRSGSAGAHQLGLLPWDSTEVLTIDGLPTGASYYPYVHGLHDGSWSVLSAGIPGGDSNGGDKLVIDTGIRHAWPLQASNTDCPVHRSFSMVVNDGTVAWFNQLDDQSYVLCTTQLPAPVDADVAATTDRPMTLLPAGLGLPFQGYQLLPVGDDVLISLPDAVRTWGTEVGEPILAIAPDGTARTLAASGHGVIPSSAGHVLAVTGTEPGQASLRDVDVATGTSVEVMPIQSIGAWYSSIAIDGTTVVYGDDSASLGGARRRTVDFGDGTAGTAALLDDDVTGPVATGQGVSAWGKSGYQGKWSTVLLDDDTRITGNSFRPKWAEQGWVRFQGAVMRLPAGTVTTLANSIAFQDGVSYQPGATVSGAAANSVVATDLVTGETSEIPVPQCTSLGDVQVAGSWLLVICPTSPTTIKMVAVDRTGAVPTRTISTGGTVDLGNGFALLRSGSGALSWASLAAPTVTWTPLGTATPSGDEAPYSVAVSRGATPSVAWFSGRSGHVALLPVSTSPLPPHPGVLEAPPAPTSLHVTIDPETGGATVSWAWTALESAEEVQSFSVVSGDIEVTGLSAATRSTPIGVPPAGTRSVQVVAHGATKTSTTELASVTFPGPGAPTMVSDSPPVVTGTARVGVALTATTGSWTPVGTYAYQWFADGVGISGATAATYIPTASVLNKQLTVQVTASKSGYTAASAVSAPTGAVLAGTFTNTVVPTITGTARVGVSLIATPGTWTPSGSYVYQWLANGTTITGATGKAYTPTAAVRGKQLSVRVTVSKSGYAPKSAISNLTAAVRAGMITNSRLPTIAGIRTVGHTLTANPGAWSPSGITFTYQWLRDGNVIAGARYRTYKLTKVSRTHRISVRVTATRVGYTTAVRTSLRTTKII